MKRIKIIVEKHPDSYIAHLVGLKGAVLVKAISMRMLWPILNPLSVSISRLLVVMKVSSRKATRMRIMSGDVVIELMQLFNQNGIEVVVDGGWGVDALLGQQTRSHGDLDIALQHKDVPQLRMLLEARGYKDVPRDDTRDCNFVMGDDKGHEVDFHSYTFDANGKIVFGVEYPFNSLIGTGSIQGYAVKCISPEWMVKFHSGYELDENDYHDVAALCKHFGFALPCEYEKFT